MCDYLCKPELLLLNLHLISYANNESLLLIGIYLKKGLYPLKD